MQMNGAGNRIVIINLIDRFVDETISAIQIDEINQQYAFDQLIIIYRSATTSVHAFVRIFNRDGSEAEACGNGMRCVAHVLISKQLYTKESDENDKVIIDTIMGRCECWQMSHHRYTIDMGAPKLQWHQIPLSVPIHDTVSVDIARLIVDHRSVVGEIKTLLNCTTQPSVVNMGNPHLIFFVVDIDRINLSNIGAFFETCSLFPNRTNVSLVTIVNECEIRQNVWERGVGPTLACGSAACAAVVACVRKQMTSRRVTVRMTGGDLHVEWCQSNNRVYLTGPVIEEMETFISI